VIALLVANLLMLALGAGLLPLLGAARSRRDLLVSLPLAYGVGIAATGIVSAHLSLAHLAVGRVGLPLLAALALAGGLTRVPGGTRRLRPRFEASYVVLLLAVALCLRAARLLAVKPLLEFDGWAIWATRARALYEYGHPVAPVFTDPTYPALQYPLLLPSLEAVDFRFLGHFDGTLVHLQLAALALAFVGGAWTLLRERVRPLLLAAVLLAIVAAPTFFNQLQTNYADIPLAMFVALGVASLTTGKFPLAALFLGAAALTKNEGELFALAALVAAAAVTPRRQLRPLGWCALAVVAIDLPWRIWVQAHHLQTRDYALSNLVDPAYLWRTRGRVGPAASELWTQLWRLDSFSLLVLLAAAGLAGGLLLRRSRAAVFAATWFVLSYAGLLLIYWISRNPLTSHLDNTSDRTIDSLVFGSALLVPVLLAFEREPEAGELRRD
jgi:hypothetical protein